MELRQLRYFVKIVELGSLGKAAVELETVPSTLSQQISRLESELSTRLLQRLPSGAVPTEAGFAFFQRAQLILRQVEAAASLAQSSRLAGSVSIGLAQTTSSMLTVPFLKEMRLHYPDIQVRIIEGLSGSLSSLLRNRTIDLAVIFDAQGIGRMTVIPLLTEQLFVIAKSGAVKTGADGMVDLRDIAGMPFLLPGSSHTLRHLALSALQAADIQPAVVAEIDGLSTLLEVVDSGIGISMQPGSAAGKVRGLDVVLLPIRPPVPVRISYLASLNDEELSSAGLAARSLILRLARDMVGSRGWPGCELVG